MMIKCSLVFMSLLLLTSCYSVNSASSNYTVRREYMRKLEYTSGEYVYDYAGRAYYPKYDPDADNPYRDFDKERYQPYPRYNPSADNPYYPPSTYSPPKIDRPQQYKDNPRKYQYPRYNRGADNPYQPPVPDKRSFDRPMFDAPLFED